MGASTRRIAIPHLSFLALALFALVMPARVLGQEQASQVGDDRLALFAKTYLEVGKARDQIHAELAKVRNKTTEAQEALRVQMREKIAEILQQNGMTEEEFKNITHIVSFDQERREKFEELMTAAANAAPGTT